MVVVAEWLRRWTRNPLGSPRAGSNPADYGLSILKQFFNFSVIHCNLLRRNREGGILKKCNFHLCYVDYAIKILLLQLRQSILAKR